MFLLVHKSCGLDWINVFSSGRFVLFCFEVFHKAENKEKVAEWDLFPLSPSGCSGGGGMQATRDLFWCTRSCRSRFSFTTSPVHLEFAYTRFKADTRTARARSIHHGTRWDAMPQYFNIGTKQWVACPLNYGIRFVTGPHRKKRISHFKMWHLVTIMIPCAHYDFIILMHSSFKTFFFSFSTCACNIFLDDTFVLKQKQCRFPEENLKCFPVADISEKHSNWSETGARALNTSLILLPAQLWSFFLLLTKLVQKYYYYQNAQCFFLFILISFLHVDKVGLSRKWHRCCSNSLNWNTL